MRRLKGYLIFTLILTLVLVLGTSCHEPALSSGLHDTTIAYASTKDDAQQPEVYEQLLVYIFDVGQAECILIKDGKHAILIDAGNTGQDSVILEYLKNCGVASLDLLIATHPHADHIGSMPAVIRNMDSISTLLMPDVIHTTATFERLLDAIEEKNIDVTIAKSGDTYEIGNIVVQVIAPNGGEYDDLNNYSVVVRVVYGQSTFLFTGDAEDISEVEQLEKSYDLSADVLKVGHHGSYSSSTERYLDAVSPSFAAISCGKDNTYGHPHKETLLNLGARGIMVYRTDENGTLVFSSDGIDITVSHGDLKTLLQSNEVLEVENSKELAYIGNVNSMIFHVLTCSSLPAEKNRVMFYTRSEAIEGNYQPCKRCNP